jgi:hypothetical protein
MIHWVDVPAMSPEVALQAADDTARISLGHEAADRAGWMTGV